MNRIIHTEQPPSLGYTNIGDFSSVLGVQKWFRDYFPNYKIINFYWGTPAKAISEVVDKDDLIFVHSGGNLGSMYLGSEVPRRTLIKNCQDNKIVILPKTIWFDESEKGRATLKESADVYNAHKDLTIISRDLDSYKFARENFSKCRNIACPCFCMYLNTSKPLNSERHGTLLVLRKDVESVFTDAEKEKIKRLCHEQVTEFDTVLDHGIPPSKCQEELNAVLNIFRKHEVVITDRMHGLLFSVITQTPCVGLPSRLNKCASGAKWFKGFKHVATVDKIDDIPGAIRSVMSNDTYATIDWKGKCFEPLKARIFHSTPYRIKSVCLLQLIKGRRSIRRWFTFPAEQREIDKILEAGAFAPSGANDQRTRLLLITNPELIKKLCIIKGDWEQHSFPPAIILVLFDLGKKGRLNNQVLDKDWYKLMWQDTAASMQNMMLMAEALGLSTCWVSLAFEHETKAVKEVLSLPDRYKIASALFIGYGKGAKTIYEDYEKLMWLGKPVKRNVAEFILTPKSYKENV